MAQIENSPRLITPDQLAWRRRVAAGIDFLIPSELNINGNGFKKFKNWVAEGKGGLLLYPHYSKDNPFVVGSRILVADPVLSQIYLSAPIAEHQYNILGGRVARLAPHVGAEAFPVITPDTIKVYRQKGIKATDIKQKYNTYRHGLIRALHDGRVGLLAPQAQREDVLTQPHLRVMRAVFKQAQVENFMEFGLLFTGLGLKNATVYERKKTGGMNLFKKCIVTVGPFYTAQEALVASGGIEGIDEWTFREMAQLAPPPYVDQAYFGKFKGL